MGEHPADKRIIGHRPPSRDGSSWRGQRSPIAATGQGRRHCPREGGPDHLQAIALVTADCAAIWQLERHVLFHQRAFLDLARELVPQPPDQVLHEMLRRRRPGRHQHRPDAENQAGSQFPSSSSRYAGFPADLAVSTSRRELELLRLPTTRTCPPPRQVDTAAAGWSWRSRCSSFVGPLIVRPGGPSMLLLCRAQSETLSVVCVT